MGLTNVSRKCVFKQTRLHFEIIFYQCKQRFAKQEKILLKTCFLSFLLLSFSLSAQRSAPVAGDAATLTDYLFKDYSTGNRETVMEDIAADRGRVIAIFKAYAKGFESSKKNEAFAERLDFFAEQDKYNKDISEGKLGYLKNLIDKKKKYYEKMAKNDTDQLDLLEKYYDKDNKFLSSVVKKFGEKYKNLTEEKTDVLAQNNSLQSMQKSVPFIGGDLLIDGIDGLSRFLAKRIKEELTLNAVQNIQKYLENKEQKNYLYELEAVLPVTVNYLKTFEPDQILKFSDDLKQYIEQDLKNILKNAQNLKNTPRVMLAIQNNPDIDFAFEGMEVIDQISKMKSPVDYFSMLENSRNLQRWAKEDGDRKKIADALSLSTMIAYSLTVIKDGEVRFITTDFVASYGSREDFVKLYFGFMHQQNIKYYNNNLINLSPFVQTEANFSEGQNYFRTQITPIAENAERLYNQYLEIKRKNKNNEDVPYKEMHGLVNDVILFAEETVRSGDGLLEILPNTSTQNYNQKLINYFKIAHLANNIMLDLDEKRYTTAITKAVEIPFMFQVQNPELDKLIKQTVVQTEVFKGTESFITLTNVHNIFSDKERREVWDKNIEPVSKFAVKLNGHGNLKGLSHDINKFIELPVDSLRTKTYFTKLDLIKSQLKTNQDDVLMFLGFDVKENRNRVAATLTNYIKSESTRNIILKQYDLYKEKVFSQYMLGELANENYKNQLFNFYKTFLPQLATSMEGKDKNNVIKLIHFVNDVAISDSPEAYERAIESYVLPVGSSSLKEKTRSYYSINAYPGILGGLEISNGRSPVGFVGLTAPVGLYIQPWSNIKNKVTWGFFVPVIDIAAPVRLRLDKANDTQTLPDFEFADILAPGFYVSLGLKNNPFAFNLGLQYGPKLRDIPVKDSSSFTSLESYRIGLGLTIDIPLVTISSRYEND